MKKFEKSRDIATDKCGDRSKCYICGSEEYFGHDECYGLCRSMEHGIRDCEE